MPVNDLITTDQKSALYRIAQEALTNIRRHAQASRVEIHLDRDEDFVTLLVYDDGVGLEDGSTSPHDDMRGMGLRNMEERLAAFNGRLVVGPRPDGQTGTRLKAVMPARQKPSRPMTILASETPTT